MRVTRVSVGDKELFFKNPIPKKDYENIFPPYGRVVKQENTTGIYNESNEFIGYFICFESELFSGLQEAAIEKYKIEHRLPCDTNDAFLRKSGYGLLFEMKDNTIINKYGILKMICDHIFNHGKGWEIIVTSLRGINYALYKELGFKYNEPPKELADNQSKSYSITRSEFYEKFPELIPDKNMRLSRRPRARSSFSESDLPPIHIGSS